MHKVLVHIQYIKACAICTKECILIIKKMMNKKQKNLKHKKEKRYTLIKKKHNNQTNKQILIHEFHSGVVILLHVYNFVMIILPDRIFDGDVG